VAITEGQRYSSLAEQRHMNADDSRNYTNLNSGVKSPFPHLIETSYEKPKGGSALGHFESPKKKHTTA